MLTVNVATVFPLDTITVRGTVAEELLLETPIEMPLAGAGPVNVMVPVAEFPPVTVVGFTDTEASATPWPAVSDKVTEEFAVIATASCIWPP